MNASLLAVALSLSILATGASAALADDTSDIQAVVTAHLIQQRVRQAGLFSDYRLIVDAPYASVQAGLGAYGNGSENFALSKTTGSWRILLSGGGLMSASEFNAAGIPIGYASELGRNSCRTRSRRHTASAALARRARLYGPSIVPKRTVRISYEGKPRLVTIMEPLDMRACVL